MTYADKDQLIADYLPEAKSPAEKAAVGRILESASAFVDSYCKRPPGYFLPNGNPPTDGFAAAGKIASFRFDASTVNSQTGYVVPPDRQLIITSLIVRNADFNFSHLDDISFFLSRSGNPAGEFQIGAIYQLSMETAGYEPTINLSAPAGDSINFNVNYAVSAGAFDVDIFGYLINSQEVDAIPEQSQATEKRVRGEGHQFLRLPVHVFGSVESVKRGESVIDSSAYYESEKNGWLYLEDNSFFQERSFSGVFDCLRWFDGETYQVKARWGYASIPQPIVEAVRLLTVSIYETAKGTLGQISVEGFALKPNLIPPDVLLILDQYKKREFEI